jgi:putative ABC transport system permease protein
MLSNLLTTSFRHLLRNKLSAAVNISGLAVALSSAFLILQYLDFELGFDTYLPGHQQVYRINTLTSGHEKWSSETYYGMADWIELNTKETAAVTRFYRWPASAGVLFEANGKLVEEKRYLFADEEFFKVFPLLVSGDPATCLSHPDAVVVSERLAKKLFATTDVVGKLLQVPEGRNKFLTVTGVMNHTPAQSHFDADVVRPYEWIPDNGDEWKVKVWTYVRLQDGQQPGSLSSSINENIADLLPKGQSAEVAMQPVSAIHLGGEYDSEAKAGTSLLNIYMLTAALILIMVIAWINYINLETARLMRRMKEVGVRRIMGSSRSEILQRLVAEYFVVSAVAVLFAAAITAFAFPFLRDIAGIGVEEFQFNVPWLWLAAVGVWLLGFFIVPTVPFLFVFRIKPALSLKGDVFPGMQASLLRKALVGFQFATSLVLIALVLTAVAQLDFMRTTDSHFNYSQVLTIHNQGNYTYREDSLRKKTNEDFRLKVLQIPGVESLTTSSAIPGEAIGFTYMDLAKRSLDDADRQVPYKVMYIDYDFVPLFGLELVAGRNYSPEHSDVLCLVVTESTVKELGFNTVAEALNQQIWFQEMEWEKWTIIGIVKDYRHESVKTPVYPTIFRLHRNRGQMVYYSLRLSEGSYAGDALPQIENAWRNVWPEKEFDHFFMDQYYDQQFKSEVQFSRVYTMFSLVALFVAGFGVMAMSLMEANARLKEISIRKVLGATVPGIVQLLARRSLQALVISMLIATPVAYLLANQWLNEFEVRIIFSPWFIAVPFAGLMTLIGLISGAQGVRAALTNPVDSLRQE